MGTSQNIVLGIDAGFTYTGWAAYDYIIGEFEEVGVISSPRPNHGQAVPGESNFVLDVRRCTKISRELHALIERIDPVGFCIETGRGFQQARPTYTMGMANGAMFSTITMSNVMHDKHRYVDMIHPTLIKKYFSNEGTKTAKGVTKSEVQESALNRWPYMKDVLAKFPKYKMNHIVDAMCAIGASIEERGLVFMLSLGHRALEDAKQKAQEAEEEERKEMKARHISDSHKVVSKQGDANERS